MSRDLVEFLLARFADDEAAVNDRTRHLSPGGWSYLEQFGDFGDDERWMIEIPADRVLADCEAKRRIVELESCYACSDAWTPCEHRNSTLRLLALPYAGHPDYQPEWRP